MVKARACSSAPKSLAKTGIPIMNDASLFVSMNWRQRLARKMVFTRLSRFDGASIHWQEAGGQVTKFGDGACVIHIGIKHPAFYSMVVFGGSVGFAEAYMRGHVECDDMVGLLKSLLANQQVYASLSRTTAWLKQRLANWHYFFQRNSKAGSKKNIAAHYDLSNDFYGLWLDDTRMYSSAYYPHDEATLEQAARHKYQKIGEALSLTPADHVLEIGTGWAGLAIYLAEHHGCRVTTTTISNEQHRYVARLLKQKNLTDQVTLLKQDYRDLEGQFDHVISIEMIEAVGHQYLDSYIETCAQRLKPKGRLFLQAIVVPHERYHQAKASVDFIKRYIFPGGFLPSVQAIEASANRAQCLQRCHMLSMGQHYAKTLAAWDERFVEKLAQVRGLGFDERFIRMWRYYFFYCQAGFLSKHIDVVQLQFEQCA